MPRQENSVVNNRDNRELMSRAYGLIVALEDFMFEMTTSVCFETFFKKLKTSTGNYQPIGS